MAAKRETAKHLEAFEAWYEAGRSVARAKKCEKMRVNPATVYRWMECFDWHERADRRDAEARKLADDAAIQAKADRIIRRRKAAEALILRGLEYLSKHPIDSARDAILAIRIGLESERKEDALPHWVEMILTASDREIEAFAKMLGLPLSGEAGAGDDSGAHLVEAARRW